jgi:3-hydroxyacyl-CoA dehydrogenase
MDSIKRVAVIGAGTMGAAIAALVANAGIPVTLLDVAPTALTLEEAQQELSLTSPLVRNRLVQAGFERLRQAKPPAIASPEAEQLITLGNTGDNFEAIAQADWIIEAIIEKLEPKRALIQQIDAVRKPGSLVTSNSSGLPMTSIVEGCSDDLKGHFFGTHFFNPPRYMKLLEIIPTADSEPNAVQKIATFAEQVLDKGIVLCKDTPNFIGNRVFTLGIFFTVHQALTQGYTIAEVDTLTGPLIGRPKTATFRLLDLIGLDIMAYIGQNLYDLIPNDPYRQVLRSPQVDNVVEELMQRRWLGNKTKQGFYKQGQDAQGQRLFMVLNLANFEYEPALNPHFEAVEAVQSLGDLGQRLNTLLEARWHADRGAQFVWSILSYDLAYAAACAQEIAYDLKSIDDAMRWGFNYEAGPFEVWDKLGVAQTATKMEQAGLAVAPWVKEMRDVGCQTFYRVEQGSVTGYYDWNAKRYRDL